MTNTGSIRSVQGRTSSGLSLWHLPLALSCLLLLGIAGGCASHAPNDLIRHEISIPFSEAEAAAAHSIRSTPYTLQAGDVISVVSQSDDDLNQLGLIVLPDGTASFMGIGARQVSSKSVNDVADMLTREYSRTFRDVQLSINVEKITDQTVYVLGEVDRPGRYLLPQNGIGLMAAIATAGGFSDWVSKGSVLMMRVDDAGYYCRELDVKGITKGEAFDFATLDLRHNDIVYVSRSKIGDFASFTRNVTASLTSYTRTILEARQIQDPNNFIR
jgi:polysaccharide biosynthesis/export protein